MTDVAAVLYANCYRYVLFISDAIPYMCDTHVILSVDPAYTSVLFVYRYS